MENSIIDLSVVFLYFAIILIAGYWVGRKHRKDSAQDYMTGGKSLNWFQSGLTLIAMSVDTGIMGVAGVGFVWGLAIQPHAVNFWFTAPLAALFLVPIYWRSKIVTTPELLEKRFSVASRAFFSGVMTLYSVIVLATSIYLGSLILTEMFEVTLWLGCLGIIGVVAVYVLLGGMKTVLSINQYQAVFIMLTLFTVAIVTMVQTGGFMNFASIDIPNEGGNVLPSTLLTMDWSLDSTAWYHFPPGLIWAGLAGAAWIACNFGMAQRLLASKDEKHAQKALLFTGFGHVATFIAALSIGVCMRSYVPDLDKADASYIRAVMDFFPVGVRGLLIAGLIASLISTIDGLLTSSSTLFTSDIYLRFIKPNSSDNQTKLVARLTQTVVIVLALLIIPLASQSRFIMDFIQSLVADLFGVVIALYLVGIFSTRATSRAALTGLIGGLILAAYLDFLTDVSFPYVGIFSFSFTVILTLGLSRFERPIPMEKLENLTVWTLTDVKGPLVGLKAWPHLLKWIIGIGFGWALLTTLWEWWIRYS